jgi:hypothetical protein
MARRAGVEDAGALDALDLDDMFADDGDMLFEGFDIDLDGMGDLTGPKASPTGAAAAAMLAASPPKRTGGPKTRRPPPPDEVDAATTGKRKTKRKSKSPALWEDESADGAAPAPKKRRSAKSATAAKGAAAQKGTAATKGKTKKETAASKKKKAAAAAANAATALPASNIPKGVAAAGRFGKRGSGVASAAKGAKVAKGGKTKVKRTSTSESTLPAGASVEAPSTLVPPKQESTFCGLHPSSTIFYPFMEALPPEPSLKARKNYPAIDKLFSTFSSALNHTPEGPIDPALYDTAIFKLLLGTFEMSEKDKANFTEEKRKSLAAAIPKVKEYISSHTDKQKLVADLFALCNLLQRQHSFLKQNLQNMERWCKNNFSPADYDATYKDPEPGTESTRKSWINSLNKPLLGVRIVCAGFKPPASAKDGNKLMCMLPISVLSKKAQNAAAAKAKKRKSDASSSGAASKSDLTAASEKAVAKKVKYADAKPAQRRQRLLDEILNKARLLESASAAKSETKLKELTKRAAEVEKLVQDDSIPNIHTSLMWQWLETAGYFASDFDPVEVRELLQTVWTPQVDRNTELRKVPTVIKGVQVKEDEEPAPSSKSLFHRLQSLLVDENESDLESDVDIGSDDDDDSSVESWGFIDQTDDDGKMDQQPMADLSALTIEERTFVTLRHLGLIQQPLYPSVKFECAVDDNGDRDEEKFQESQEFPDVIEAMAEDLNRLSTLNNSRVAFLQATSQKMHARLKSQKRLDDESTVLNTKCQALMKKAKESKSKKSKAKKDELNLPW